MAVATHRVEVVPFKMEPHPNADSLSIVRVFGFTVCVRTADWQGVEKAAYIQPDSIVPDNEQFAWLKAANPKASNPFHIKVKKLRGVISMGMMVPAPEGSQIGDDVAEILGVTHYEPPIPLDSEAELLTVNIFAPKYDVESMYRYASLFKPGELVWVSEKIHGENTKYFFDGMRMWAGTRNQWNKPGQGRVWACLKQNPWIEGWCRENPMKLLYGEVFGAVQSLRYGAQGGQFFFRAFDVLHGTEYYDVEPFIAQFDEPEKQIVPSVGGVHGLHRFDLEMLKALAEGPSLIPGANHIREGIVVKPMEERQDPTIGRVFLKIVSNAYLEKY